MKIAIMQPYFFPYIGYFQLMKYVDIFVVYDNIKYTKKGWINRNRILFNGKEELFTIPIKKGSDFLNIDERFLSDNALQMKNKFLKKIELSYKNAPYYNDVFSIIKECILYDKINLFSYIFNSLIKIRENLNLNTEFIISSKLNIDHALTKQDKVIEICRCLNATDYINSYGGIDLYSREQFEKNNLKLSFLKTNYIKYHQFYNDFVSSLSIIDVMMFNSKKEISNYMNDFNLV